MPDSAAQADRQRVVLWVLVILAVAAAAVLLASFLWTPERFAGGAPWDLVGLHPRPCPGCPWCGMSRAFAAMSHLRFRQAVGYNAGVLLHYPLAWFVLLAGVRHAVVHFSPRQ